jgi:hypothetical protein
VHLPKVEGADATVRPAVFDGIDVVVKVTATTSVVVSVDGKEAWRGTVLAGTTKKFTGLADVTITTGNAGATGVIITNAVMANKKIDALGSNGEIRRNQKFEKTTLIQ